VAVNPFNVIQLVVDPKGGGHSRTTLPDRKTTPTATRPTPLTLLTSSSRHN
jgi:hypothetical protein